MKPRTPTFDETLEAARRAAEEIRREWPDWKRALSHQPGTIDAATSVGAAVDRSDERGTR